MTSDDLAPNGYVDLLRKNPRIRRLWSAQVVSELGDWFSLVALFALVRRYSSSAQAAGMVLIIQALPTVLLAPITGTIADRFDRRRLMIAADLCRAVVALGFLGVGWVATPETRLTWLYALCGLQFTFTAFFEPARAAMIPQLATPAQLPLANALGSVTWSVMLAVGGALGGLLTGLVSPQAAFGIDSLTFVTSALILLKLRAPEAPVPASGEPQASPRLLEVLGEVRRRKHLLAALLVHAAITLSAGGLWLLSTIYGQRVFPVGEAGAFSVGVLLAMQGVGALVGAALTRRVIRLSSTDPGGGIAATLGVMSIAFTARSLGFVLLAYAPALPVAALALAASTACGGLCWVAGTTLLQHFSHDRIRGRLFALSQAAATLSFVIGTRLTAWAMDSGGLRPQSAALGVAAVTGLVAATWIAAALRFHRWQAEDRR